MFEAGIFGTLECAFYDMVASVSEWSTRSDRSELLACGMFEDPCYKDYEENVAEAIVESSIRERVKEINSMRELLDIMKKQIMGELSQEGVRNEFQKHALEWSQDMRNLIEMIKEIA